MQAIVPISTPQYDLVDRTSYYTNYKRQRGINGAIPILVAHAQPFTVPEPDPPYPPNLPNIFSVFHTLPIEHQDTPIHAYPVVDNKNDTLTQSQMLKDEAAPAFISSQVKEMQRLINMDVFDILHISTKPELARLLSSIWSYCWKRNPLGKILKHKSCICVDGSQQLQGRDNWKVYAPVVSLPTIHLTLLLSTILDLKQRQVDYTQAFPQAPLTEPVYMKIPQGWYVDAQTGTLHQHSDPTYNHRDQYIRLKRNLYGCKQATWNWFRHLRNGLLAEGFRQSKADPCLFLRQDCILIVYTDDCIFFAEEDSTIDALIANLSKTYLLEDQGLVQDYLGIWISKDPVTKCIHMTQTGLIESVLQDLNLLNDSKMKDTPSLGILYPDRDGVPRQHSWNYRSVIGKLNYIAQNTRPDISFAVHQCAGYSSNPTALHKLAVKRIGRYLLATRDKGLILQPTHNFILDMFVNADFAGMWHHEYSKLWECAFSRTGYVITYCGCPVHWASKLQSEIALSTTESEYIALSMASRELLPLRHLVTEFHQHGLFSAPLSSPFSVTSTSTLEATTIYEDNASCVALAHSEGTKVRTKYIS
jgi:hypothetical protein